jgi:hypothetical protein
MLPTVAAEWKQRSPSVGRLTEGERSDLCDEAQDMINNHPNLHEEFRKHASDLFQQRFQPSC